jgi:hypothetical protein
MIGTGKYNFPGFKKAGAAAFRAVLVGTQWGSAALASPFRPIIDFLLEYASEWLANRGLLIINVGAIYVNGQFEQATFDAAFEDALKKSKAPGLTDAQKKVIDDQVIKAFRPFARLTQPH